MKVFLIVVVAAAVGCSPHAAEWPRETRRLPNDLKLPIIVREAEGVILDANKRPVVGALVSVIDTTSYRGIGFSISDGDGKFAVGLPATPVVVTVTGNGHVSGALAPTAAHGRLTFALASASEATRRFSGAVVDVKGKPLARVRVRLMSWTWPVGAAFYASTDDAGRFQFLVDAGGPYDLLVDDSRYVSNFTPLMRPSVDDATLIAYGRDWIKEEASRADETELRDLCVPFSRDAVLRIAGSLRGSRVVGLGESTHGTREYTELRSRVIQGLVENGWLTTIALEASWQEVSAIDDYVRRGKGTGRAAVKSLMYWPWRTEEFLAFVEAIRTLNDQLPAEKKIEFLGVDYAPPGATVDFMSRYFQEWESAHPGALAGLAPLRRIESWTDATTWSAEERAGVVRTLGELRHVAEAQSPTSLQVLQGLDITRQIIGSHDEDFRDRVMADAVLALVSEPKRERNVAIWAHSGHLAQAPIEGAVPMGNYLGMQLGEHYRAIGSAFYDGKFQTYSGQREGMVSHVVERPPSYYLEGTMHRVSPSAACVLDVAEAVRRPRVHDWIYAPKYVRFYGGLEISESYPWPPVVVPELWSAMIFVPTSTATTLLDYEALSEPQ